MYQTHPSILHNQPIYIHHIRMIIPSSFPANSTVFILFGHPRDQNPRQMPELRRIPHKPDLFPESLWKLWNVLVFGLSLVPDMTPVLEAGLDGRET